MSGICGPHRFHAHHGSNIQLDEERRTATRETSFANGLTFSERGLGPGEIFLVEIEEIESGWSGHMRIGLTQLSPDDQFDLPLYALPDLVSMGPSWLYAITKTHGAELIPAELPEEVEEPLEEEPLGLAAIHQQNMFNYRRFPRVVHREGCMIRTPRGVIHENKLLPNIRKTLEKNDMSILPTDVGSRIGVMFVPTSETIADMHFIINGEDQGPCSRDIPFKDGPLFGVVDVYGSTKRVRLVRTDGVESLQSMCRDKILRSIKLSGVSYLPLPKLLKDYLLYN